jgi:RHS repeat-associated protein
MEKILSKATITAQEIKEKFLTFQPFSFNAKKAISLICFMLFFITANATYNELNVPNGVISLMGPDYTDYRNDVWYINCGTNQAITFNYFVSLENGYDYVQIYSIDSNGYESSTPIATLTGDIGNGIVTTDIPSGRAKVIFHSDGSGCYTSGYQGFAMYFAPNGISPLDPGYVYISNTTVVSGTSPGTFYGSAASGGNCATHYYLWQQSADGIYWSTCSGSPDAECYTVPTLTATTYFRRVVFCNSSYDVTNVTCITVTPPAPYTLPTDKTYKKPNGTFTTDPSQGVMVGSVPGSASVTPTGAATYQIPIEVPTGINGMQPQLSIAYNSQGGFGALGVGWDVAGCSSITRGGKNIYFDGQNNNNVKLDFTDALYLDGQRLILLSGNNLEPDAVYGTETENYMRVKISTYNYHIYFIVTTLDGKVIEYGKNDDSEINSSNPNGPYETRSPKSRFMGWKLSKVTDTYGNTITYTYSDNGQYLTRIEYAGQAVVFNYINNALNPRKSYIQDFIVLQNKLLHSIAIQSGSTTLKTYSFDYLSDNKLNTISLKASDNSAVSSTQINWGADNNTVQFSQLGTITDTGLSSQPDGLSSIDFADIDGDGYPDRIERWIGSNSEDGHIKIFFYDNVNKTFGNAQTATLTIPFGDYNTYHQQFIYADINNDGKAEIIYTDKNKLYVKKYVYTGNNRSNYSFLPCFTETVGRVGDEGVITSDYIFGYYDSKVVKIVTADINRDNYLDIVMAFYNKGPNLTANGRRGYAIFFGGQNGINPTPVFNYVNRDYSLQHLEIGDFNADGKLDIVCLPSNKTIFEADVDNEILLDDQYISMVTDRTWNINDIGGTKDQVLDFNGDGLSDLITMCPSNDIWRSSTNTGGAFNQPTLRNEPFTGPNVHFIDINGDGLVDAVNYANSYHTETVPLDPVYDEYGNRLYDYDGEGNIITTKDISVYDNTSWSIYLNKGNGQFSTTPLTLTTTTEIYSNLQTVSDINGDGIADFIITQGANMYALTMPNANRRNLVSSITNGMNQTESFTYKNFSAYDAYSSTEATAKVRPLRAPLLLVDTYTQLDGNVTAYDYTIPKYHTEGKGFLGFTTVTATNSQKNAKVISNYEINQTYFFPVLVSQRISTATGTDNVSVSSLTNGVKVIDATNKRYIPTVTAQSSTDILKGITQTGSTDYTNYPNSLAQTTTVGDLTTTAVTTFTGPSGKTPYLPATVISTRTQNGKSYTRETDYAYTFDGSNPYKIIGKTETVDPGDVNSVVTIFSNYDSWGHPQSVAVSANGITRLSSVSYTSSRSTSGRFLQSKTNVLLETTNYNWNETTGLLNSTTDSRNRVTSYAYDSFGQLIETYYPDGTQKFSTKQWAGTGGVAGAVYYGISQGSGTASAIVWYDALGREIQSDTYGLNNNKISASTEYYTSGANKGRLYRVSEPYFASNTGSKIWSKTYTTYDDYGRPTLITTPMGNVTTEYNTLTTKVTTPEGTTETTLNSAGQTVTSKVNDKPVYYAYYASGLTKTNTPDGGQAITMVYNLQGNRIKLIDPDGGLTRSEYNGFGQLTKEVQRVHLSGDSISTVNTYKPDGRLESINRNSEVTNYIYDTSNKSIVNSISIANKNTQTFSFDEFDRVTGVTETITANGTTKTYTTSKEYDALGRISKEIYPSGYYTKNTYDQYSNLTEVRDEVGAGHSIWKADTENARGQLTSVIKGTKTSTYGYDSNGMATSIYAPGVVDMTYHFTSNGNLEYRTDNRTTQQERFIYDVQNRLTNWDIYQNGGLVKQNSHVYDQTTGNITSRTNFDITKPIGYGGNRIDGSAIGPHAPAIITGNPADIPSDGLTVTYTDFKKIATLSEGGKTYSITYGADDQRRVSVQTVNGVTTTHYYVGNYEEIITGSVVKKIHYLSGAIFIQETSQPDKFYYSYADYQGSLLALTDESGNLVEQRYAYDPWGVRRNPDNWTQRDTRASWIVNRGYTGHEHLDAFGIINMNGRVYDPATGTFFSPDPVLTDAGNWLDYNRYGYCLNNPLKYTDPSGYTWWAENWQPVVTTVASIGAGALVVLSCGTATPVVVTGMLAGAAGGFTGGFVGTAAYGGSFNQCLTAGLQGAVIGGISGAITAGIGAQFGAVGSIGNELGRAGAHALAQGAFSAIRGGNFWQGAAAGLVSSLGGSAAGALRITDFVGTVAVTSAMGGVGAMIGGAKSAEDILFGMAAGAMVGALNFAEEILTLDKAIGAAGFDPNDVAKWTNEELTANMAKIFPELYKAANNPKIEATDEVINGKNLSIGTALKETWVSGKGVYSVNSKGLILIRSFTLASVRWAASVVGHELNHVIDYVSGTYAGWMNQYGLNGALNRSETKAYGWEIKMGSSYGDVNQYNYYKNLIK